jgi:SAM-dependent methyltransferase
MPMAGETTTVRRSELGGISSNEMDSEQANTSYWKADHVRDYATRGLRPVERVVIDRYRDRLAGGKVLELGCGAGRVTGHLAEVAGHVHALDISPSMVAYCRWAYPRSSFRIADMRDLDEYDDGLFDAVVASFNVVDVLTHEERQQALETWRRVLRPNGLFIMSSHNRGHVTKVPTPSGQVIASLRSGSPKRVAASVAKLPRRVRNRRRMGRFERRESDYAVVTDSGGDYGLLHYYITRDDQARQLAQVGLDLIEALDLSGDPVEPGDSAPDTPEIHYIARAV